MLRPLYPTTTTTNTTYYYYYYYYYHHHQYYYYYYYYYYMGKVDHRDGLDASEQSVTSIRNRTRIPQ
jgi:hypothetical protein